MPQEPVGPRALRGRLQRRHRHRRRRRPGPGRARHRHRRLDPRAGRGQRHTGLKPTFGRVPKYGCVPLGYSLDNIGPMARTAWDCAAMLQVMAGYDAARPDRRRRAGAGLHRRARRRRARACASACRRAYFFDAPELDAEVKAAVLDGDRGPEARRARSCARSTIPHADVAKTRQQPDHGRPRRSPTTSDDLRDALAARTAATRARCIARGALFNGRRLRPGAALPLATSRRPSPRAMADVDVLVTPTIDHARPRSRRHRHEQADAGRRASRASGTWSACRRWRCRAASARADCRCRCRSSASRSTRPPSCASATPISAPSTGSCGCRRSLRSP